MIWKCPFCVHKWVLLSRIFIVRVLQTRMIRWETDQKLLTVPFEPAIIIALSPMPLNSTTILQSWKQNFHQNRYFEEKRPQPFHQKIPIGKKMFSFCRMSSVDTFPTLILSEIFILQGWFPARYWRSHKKKIYGNFWYEINSIAGTICVQHLQSEYKQSPIVHAKRVRPKVFCHLWKSLPQTSKNSLVTKL